MRKLEYKIDDLLVEKNEFGQEIINDLLIPSTAFVTFVTDDAKEDALHLADAFSKGQMNSELPASVSEDFKLIGNHGRRIRHGDHVAARAINFVFQRQGYRLASHRFV